MRFHERVRRLPHLGLGISTEYGAARTGLDILELADRHGDLCNFLEIGADLERGFDADTERWIDSGRPTTYHFLDVNLEEPEDIDEDWVRDTTALADRARAAWICGDAGLWHVGPRERGHGILMPPVLTKTSAEAMAVEVRRLQDLTGREIVPENPPAHVFLGDMHILDYFSRVAETADCGLVLDVAHLAICQRALGKDALEGVKDMAIDRVIEVHVAGGSEFEHGGRTFVDDDHGERVLDDTWRIFEYVARHATNMKAVVIEGERNSIAGVLPIFERTRDIWAKSRAS